jgi:hypothetical protein
VVAPIGATTECGAEVALYERNGRPLEARMSSGAAPSPRQRVGDEIRLDGVEREIPAGGDELLVAADLSRHRVSAKEVRAPAIAAAVVTGVFRVQTLECLRDAGVGNAEDDVVMVSHEDVRDQAELEALANAGESVEEVFAIFID